MYNVVIGEKFQPLFTPAPYKCYYGGRGSAKSHSFALVLAILSDMKKLKIVCARQFQNSIRESVKELIETKIEELEITHRFRFTENSIINIHTGSRFIFIGLDRNPASAKSLEGCDICWVEEAQTVSANALEILLPTIRKKGSELWFSYNPEEPDDPVDDMFRGKEPPKNAIIVEVSFLDNPHFYKTRLPQEMANLYRRNKERYKHVWLGKYRTLTETSIFGENWREGVLDVGPNEIPIMGADWGFSQDPNTLIKMYMLNGNTTLYITDEAYGAGVPTDDLEEFFLQVPGAKETMIIADSSRPDTIDYMRRRNFVIHPAKKGAGSVKDGIAWLQGLDIVIHPRCKNTIHEVKKYSWQVDRKTNKILSIPIETDNHCIDAIRYGTELYRAQ